MKKDEWKNRITESCEKAGTYRSFFDDVIDTLANILEKRDDAESAYKKSGSKAVVEHTNKGGATNTVKNPLLVLIGELNTQALAYWRDLGLTPAGLKKINDKALEKRKTNILAEALKDLGG